MSVPVAQRLERPLKEDEKTKCSGIISLLFGVLDDTLLTEVFFLPLLFRSLFAAVSTVVVFFHREENLCHDTFPPVEENSSGGDGCETSMGGRRGDEGPLVAGYLVDNTCGHFTHCSH